MASSIIISLTTIITIITLLLLFPALSVAEEDIVIVTTPTSAYDHVHVSLNNIHTHSLHESIIQEKIHGLESKDETIKWMDDNIRKRSAIIASLQSDILAAFIKGSLEAKEQVHKAQARIDELETQVVNLSKQTDEMRKKRDKFESLAHKQYSYLNSTLESLMRINDEQKSIILKYELDRQLAEEEMMKTKKRETAFFRELIEVQGSWFPYWLSVSLLHYQKSVDLHIGKLQKLAGPHFQEVKKFIKPWADPVFTVTTYHIDNVQIFMKPCKKKLQTLIREFSRKDELTEALKIFLFLALAFMASQMIFRKQELQRCNSHEEVAKGDRYLYKTGSGAYTGEITQKNKKRKMRHVIEGPDEGTKEAVNGLRQPNKEYIFKRPSPTFGRLSPPFSQLSPSTCRPPKPTACKPKNPKAQQQPSPTIAKSNTQA